MLSHGWDNDGSLLQAVVLGLSNNTSRVAVVLFGSLTRKQCDLLLAGLPAFEHVRDIQFALDAKKRTWLPPIFRHQAKERCMSAFRFNHSLWHLHNIRAPFLNRTDRTLLGWYGRRNKKLPILMATAAAASDSCDSTLFQMLPRLFQLSLHQSSATTTITTTAHGGWGRVGGSFGAGGPRGRQRRIRRAGSFATRTAETQGVPERLPPRNAETRPRPQ